MKEKITSTESASRACYETRVAMTAGTIVVRRPRARNLAERFESRVLPLFKRRSTSSR